MSDDPVNFVDPMGLYDTNLHKVIYSGWKYGNNGRYKTLIVNGIDKGRTPYTPFEYYNGKSPSERFVNGVGNGAVRVGKFLKAHPDGVGLTLSIWYSCL